MNKLDEAINKIEAIGVSGGRMKAKYYALTDMERKEIECDSIELITDDGQEIELQFSKSDNEISLLANRHLILVPVAANVISIRTEH